MSLMLFFSVNIGSISWVTLFEFRGFRHSFVAARLVVLARLRASYTDPVAYDVIAIFTCLPEPLRVAFSPKSPKRLVFLVATHAATIDWQAGPWLTV